MQKRLTAMFALLVTVASYGAEVECHSAPPVRGYELGLTLQTMLPNELPDFAAALPVYGPLLGVSIGPHNLVVRGLYGAIEALSTYVVEAGVRWNIDLHFFHMYALTGGQLLHYSYAGSGRQYVGGNLGMGIVIPISGKYQVTVGAKAYITSRTLMNFETGFSIFL